MQRTLRNPQQTQRSNQDLSHMKTTSTTEAELRAEQAPVPKTIEELNEYIASLEAIVPDYGIAVYVVSLSATATYNYLSYKHGMTGFQASCADLDIIRRTRHLECPFMLVKADDMLFPQYDMYQNLSDAMREWMPWASQRATELLKDTTGCHPSVVKRWHLLAVSRDSLPIFKKD